MAPAPWKTAGRKWLRSGPEPYKAVNCQGEGVEVLEQHLHPFTSRRLPGGSLEEVP